MKKVKKGQIGYFAYEKKKRVLITAVLFAVPLLIFITGLLRFHTRMTWFTIIAVVGCLPACKSTVSMLMMLMRKSMDRKLYEKIKSRAGQLTMCYELYVTSYEKSGYLDAVAICGNTVAAYSSSDKIDAAYMAQQIQKILRQNGYKVTVKVFRDINPFLDRLDSLNEHKEALEKDIPYTPDERYPDLTRNELIMHTILAISL